MHLHDKQPTTCMPWTIIHKSLEPLKRRQATDDMHAMRVSPRIFQVYTVIRTFKEESNNISVCICVCVCACEPAGVDVLVCAYVQRLLLRHVHVCMCMFVCIHVCMYVCVYVCICVHVQGLVCGIQPHPPRGERRRDRPVAFTHIHTYTRARMNADTHIHA